MTFDPFADQLLGVPGPPPRCHAQTRTPAGYAACHRDLGHLADGIPHHVNDREWAPTPSGCGGLRLGVPCDPAYCHHPEQVTPYLGSPPRGGSGGTPQHDAERRAARRRLLEATGRAARPRRDTGTPNGITGGER